MTKPHSLLFELQKLVADLAMIDRNHYLLGTDTRENDIEHSFTVAMLCWFIVSHKQLPLKLDLTLEYALVHDFVERYAGDTNTFADQAARKQKIENEKLALSRLHDEFVDFPDMLRSLDEYESKLTEEALFVWTVDKMQALVLGDLDSWRPYKELDISYEQFTNKYRELIDQASPHCKDIFESLVLYSQSTYYARPNTGN